MTQAAPLIELSAFYERETRPAAELHALLKQVDEALCSTGFLCVQSSAWQAADVLKAQQAAMAFFDLAPEIKNRARSAQQAARGYTAVGELGLSYAMDASDIRSTRSSPPDLFERYRIGPVDDFGPPYADLYSDTAYAGNIWPVDLPEFQTAMTAYYRKVNVLSRDLLRLFALTLGMEEHWFESKVNRSMASLAINNYPAQLEPPLPGQLRAGPHTDYGTLTMVAPTDAPGGLQIRTKTGQWQDVAVQPGTFVVNIGDMMAQWTNDRWVSTVHRVANPPPGKGAETRRLALVFFHQPNPDTTIECIPTCISGSRPAKYEPVNAGDYISAKINRHFKSHLSA